MSGLALNALKSNVLLFKDLRRAWKWFKKIIYEGLVKFINVWMPIDLHQHSIHKSLVPWTVLISYYPIYHEHKINKIKIKS